MTATLTVEPIQRPLKGSRISSFYPVKELPPLSALDSAFQLQEYISLLIRKDVHDVDAIVSIPGKGRGRESSGQAKGEESEGKDADVEHQKEQENAGVKEGEGKEVAVDEACWIYEQLRRLAQDLSHPLITMLQQECTRQTCPEMKAGEWLYLCVAHGSEGAMEQCCAIDYILHTLDSATGLLNSPRAFPSRLSIPAPSHRHFSSLARRLGRIFAHAYFHHRAVFAQAEAESSLYARFLALTSRFDLVPAEFLVIPPGTVGYGADERDRDGLDEYPRLLAASIDSKREHERGRDDETTTNAQRGGILQLDALGGVLPSLSQGEPEKRDASPRKMGRNRTDTMVYSEAASVVEELGRAAAMGDNVNAPQTETSITQPETTSQDSEQGEEAHIQADRSTTAVAVSLPTTEGEVETVEEHQDNVTLEEPFEAPELSSLHQISSSEPEEELAISRDDYQQPDEEGSHTESHSIEILALEAAEEHEDVSEIGTGEEFRARPETEVSASDVTEDQAHRVEEPTAVETSGNLAEEILRQQSSENRVTEGTAEDHGDDETQSGEAEEPQASPDTVDGESQPALDSSEQAMSDVTEEQTAAMEPQEDVSSEVRHD